VRKPRELLDFLSCRRAETRCHTSHALVRAAFDILDQLAHVLVELLEMQFERSDAFTHQNTRAFVGFECVLEARHDVWRRRGEILARRFFGHFLIQAGGGRLGRTP
jgi:hypothetical protein